MRIAAILALGALGALAACAAQAQTRSVARDHGQYGIGDPHDGPSARGRSRPGSSAATCLVRKADGQRVCHTPRRWREIARRLEGEEGAGR